VKLGFGSREFVVLGELVEKGECRLSRRSASETRTGSGVGIVWKAALGGGGIFAGSNAWGGA